MEDNNPQEQTWVRHFANFSMCGDSNVEQHKVALWAEVVPLDLDHLAIHTRYLEDWEAFDRKSKNWGNVLSDVIRVGRYSLPNRTSDCTL